VGVERLAGPRGPRRKNFPLPSGGGRGWSDETAEHQGRALAATLATRKKAAIGFSCPNSSRGVPSICGANRRSLFQHFYNLFLAFKIELANYPLCANNFVIMNKIVGKYSVNTLNFRLSCKKVLLSWRKSVKFVLQFRRDWRTFWERKTI
jgi:hypothetical protein